MIALPLARLMAIVPDQMLALLNAISRLGLALPGASVRVGRYPMALHFVHWCAILAMSELSRIPLKRRRFMPALLLLLAGLSTLLTFAGAWRFSVVFMDAGQADCAVVRTRGHTWLMDTGDTYTPVADYLGATCLHLDGVFLSHPHQDHAGGLSSVLAAFRPDAIYVPKGWFARDDTSDAVAEGINRAAAMGIPVVELDQGDLVRLSPVATLTVCSASPEEPPENANDLSLLALIECEGQRALFTGDLPVSAEPEAIPDADLLKVAHHGSSKATSDRFVAACTPEIAVISVGDNSYGHPSDDTLAKLRKAGAAVYLTRERGAITLTYVRGAWQVHTYLEAVNELE